MRPQHNDYNPSLSLPLSRTISCHTQPLSASRHHGVLRRECDLAVSIINPNGQFLFVQEGASHSYMHQLSKYQDSQYEAEFPMSAEISALGGIYTFFGANNSSPCLLSHSSVPVEIIVSGEMILKCVRSDGNTEYLTLEALDWDGYKFILRTANHKGLTSQ